MGVTRGQKPGAQVSPQWASWRLMTDLDEYATRWDRLAASGTSVHGEADFIESLGPRSVLDAGCGTGRVAIELDRRGIDVVGVDLDDDMLQLARDRAPAIAWVHADLATVRLGRTFDVVAMPGNVMLFCRASDRSPIIASMAEHLAAGGLLVAGFTLGSSRDAITLEQYDEACDAAELELIERWGGWDRSPPVDDYAVSVHRRR